MLVVLRWSRLNTRAISNFSTSFTSFKQSDGNDENDESRQQNASNKLKDLLIKMAADKSSPPEPKIKTARPIKRIVEKRPIHKVKLEKIKDAHTSQLVAAVKEVADEVGGPDTKATEAELLYVILNNKQPDKKVAENKSLESVITGMQVEKHEDTRAVQVRRAIPQRKREKIPKPKVRANLSFNLFGDKRLGIFPSDYVADSSPTLLSIWSKLAEKDLKLKVTHPPSNIYEEMMRWTDQGLLWKFPIDNEQGLDEEKDVDFTQHVFLEEHLEGWCPSKGPIRHFMELVLVGLSKNPYITVEAKINHIHWFRDYFESKKQLLVDTGAIPTESSSANVKA